MKINNVILKFTNKKYLSCYFNIFFTKIYSIEKNREGQLLCFIPLYWAVRPPPQNLAKAKNLGRGSTAHKSPIGSTNNQCGDEENPH